PRPCCCGDVSRSNQWRKTADGIHPAHQHHCAKDLEQARVRAAPSLLHVSSLARSARAYRVGGESSGQRCRRGEIVTDRLPELISVRGDVCLVARANSECGSDAADGDELVDVIEKVANAVVSIVLGSTARCVARQAKGHLPPEQRLTDALIHRPRPVEMLV